MDVVTGAMTCRERSTPAGASEGVQFADHVGCGRIELDDSARVVGYAEYLPFGAVSYRAGTSALEASSGQRGYAGLERDPDTGFDYAGARWYAPWLGRWMSPDPLGGGEDLSPSGSGSSGSAGVCGRRASIWAITN